MMSGVACHVSCVTFCVSSVMCHVLRVTCHVSRVMCHVLRVTFYMSRVTCHFSEYFVYGQIRSPMQIRIRKLLTEYRIGYRFRIGLNQKDNAIKL